MSKIIAVVNQKGGVAKTTTAVNVAAGMAIRGHKVLLVDLDQQRNATISVETPPITTTLADVLIGAKKDLKDARSAVYETHLIGLDIMPASIRLALVDKLLSFAEQYRLRDSLLKLTDYDFIIIDCPRSLGAAVTQALLAAEYVIVPLAAEFYALEGILDLQETIEETKRANESLKILGYVVTRFDVRMNVCKAALKKVQEMMGDLVFETVIHSDAQLYTAPAAKKSIYEAAPASRANDQYLALTDEVLDRLQTARSHNLQLVEETRKVSNG